MFDNFDFPLTNALEYLIVFIALAFWVPILIAIGWAGIEEIWKKWRK